MILINIHDTIQVWRCGNCGVTAETAIGDTPYDGYCDLESEVDSNRRVKHAWYKDYTKQYTSDFINKPVCEFSNPWVDLFSILQKPTA